MRKLTLADIKDLREYERERDEFRHRVIAMKKRRRIQLGDLLTIVFENTETMRFQVQEMARSERMLSDEQILQEIEVYNELIPDRRELSGTLFVELDSPEKLKEWLPKLVGVERAVVIVLADGTRVPGISLDEERLTREDVTAAVHFLKFRFLPDEVEFFRSGPVTLVVDHPDYVAETELDADQHAAVAADFSAE